MDLLADSFSGWFAFQRAGGKYDLTLQHQVISDVPERGSFALLGFGSLLTLMWRKRARLC